MVEYKDRLAQAMKDARVTTSELARALRISYQAVRKVLLGGQFGTDNNAGAAKRLGVRSDWLATGKGPKTAGDGASRQETEADWPFSEELQQKVLLLSDEELLKAENVLRAHLGVAQKVVSDFAHSRQLSSGKAKREAYSGSTEEDAGEWQQHEVPASNKQHGSRKNQRSARQKSGRGA